MRYIDTSAFVKYYATEETEKGADKINNIINNAKEGKEILTSSIFMIGEAISVFDRWVRLKIITNEESQKIISKFLNDINELIEADSLYFENIDTIVKNINN